MRWPPARPCRARPDRPPTDAAPVAGRRWPVRPGRERGARRRRSSQRERSRSLPREGGALQRPGSTRRRPAAGPGRGPRRRRPAPPRPRRVPSRRGARSASPRRPPRWQPSRASATASLRPTGSPGRARSGARNPPAVTPGPGQSPCRLAPSASRVRISPGVIPASVIRPGFLGLWPSTGSGCRGGRDRCARRGCSRTSRCARGDRGTSPGGRVPAVPPP